jgi:hypothetical protein
VVFDKNLCLIRVGQQGSITRIWAKKGTRPRAVRQQQFECGYKIGAVCPPKDKPISLNLVLADLRLGLKNRQVGEKWVSDDCSYLCKSLFKIEIIRSFI